MKFPQIIRHHRSRATIYGRSDRYPYYRICFYAAGKRTVRSFASYADARKEAETKVRELSRGNQSVALSSKEATDALAIREALDAYRRETGRSIGALQAVTLFLAAAKQLGDRPLPEAVDGYLRTVAVVRRKSLADAVADFVAFRAPKGEAREGKRSAPNPKYVENTASWIQEFAEMFPGHDVGDLSTDVLGAATTTWAMPSVPFNLPKKIGSALPKVGAAVWIEFEKGDPDYPIWSGCFFDGATETPPSLRSTK